MTAIEPGGDRDHIHALLLSPTTLNPADMAQVLKKDSSKWIHREFRNLRDFGWQDGYSAFTVSKSNVPTVARYIRNQHEHHKKQSFQEEVIQFLKKHGVDYDVKYLWG
jgi:REP element-mobilizing transposase RayT